MVSITFLGTGGGRINLIRQVRGTGGFLIISKHLIISVDPGPGALSTLNRFGINPESINAVIITHDHVDHLLEAPLIIEAMSGFMLNKGGVLISAKSVVDNDANADRSITLYHQSKLAQNIILRAGEKKKITIEKGGREYGFLIQGTNVKHEDIFGFGFVLEIDGKKIGYTSDTEYIKSVHESQYAGLDLLIANCLKPAADEIAGHMHSIDLSKLLLSTKPSACLLTHMGMKMLAAGPEKEAGAIEKISGVRTIAGRDGYEFDLERGTYKKYEKPSKPKSSEQKKLA
ncbi:MAG: MBL fold metallo-hydrolase [Candidatus Micrarchaeia archaeon]